ncbi:MAG: hypothetical protein CVV42_12995 [Candidatus Riflebacteria bacterium HGW-Riflebacteria-2]|jgi:hypothetical protein|nr:MAG: hypothetical protein CVV42_12995 [Candidatus Riflebacteria bacterium HGW-Riflebacteria-2]
MAASLSKLVADCKCLAIIGTEKNAGKTTVLNYLLAADRRADLAITSIGYDGEDIDQVTGTDKPSVYVGRGTLVATAVDLLGQCDFTRELLRFTGFYTPLGEVVILRALSDGYAMIAGPSTTSQMTRLTRMLQQEKAGRIIIDGAAARRSSAAVSTADGCILATGASYSPDPDVIVEHTRHIADLLTLPAADNVPETIFQTLRQAEDSSENSFGAAHAIDCFIIDSDNQITDSASSFDDSAADLISAKKTRPLRVFFIGAVTARLIQKILERSRSLQGLQLIAADGTRFLLSPAQFDELRRRGAELAVIKPVNLLAVTVNPKSPEGFCLDSSVLCQKLKTVLSVEVFDIMAYRESYDQPATI